jgi:hypothetical protein
VSLSWQLVKPSFCTMLMFVLLLLQTLMSILFLFVDQQQLAWYTHFSQTMIILMLSDVNILFMYNNVLHWIRWELISHCTSMSFWFRVKVCWFSAVVSTVRNMIWHSFQNVVVCQNISVSVAATASDMTTLLTALYATMMFSLSSWRQWTTTVSMRVSVLLNWDELHWPCCQRGSCYQPWSLGTYDFFFSFLALLLV